MSGILARTGRLEASVKRQWFPVAIVAVAGTIGLGIASSACQRSGGEAVSVKKAAPAVASHNTSGVRWTTDWEAALAQAKKENKVVVIDFYADWCVWCRRLDSTTYRDPKVVHYLTERTVPLKLDVDASPGRAMANRYGVDGLPTILILSADGKEIGRIPGYMPAKGFLEAVQRYASTG